MDRVPRSPLSPRIALALALAACAAALLAPSTATADEKGSRLDREISVMEKVIDAMLVDSPNFLVSGHEVTQGFDIEDYGALFTFKASLTGWFWTEGDPRGILSFLPFGGKHRIIVRKGDGGDRVIDLGDGSIVIKDGTIMIREDGKTRKLSEKDGIETIDEKTFAERQLKKYEAAKEELVRTMIDYGETLRALPPGQSVRFVARLSNLDLPEGKEVRTLSVRASIDDLRAHADGRLSESALRDRIDVRES